MKKNIGTKDRLARLALAILAGSGALFADSIIIQAALVLLALFILYEALAGWCAFYAFIGKNTCPINLKNISVNSRKKKVLIVGAGPGGLAAGMI